jgi:hypothetical protein
MKCEIGDEVEVARFGQKMTGRITGVFVYPSGTSDYSIGCPHIAPFWIHMSYITRLIKAS